MKGMQEEVDVAGVPRGSMSTLEVANSGLMQRTFEVHAASGKIPVYGLRISRHRLDEFYEVAGQMSRLECFQTNTLSPGNPSTSYLTERTLRNA